MPTRYQQLRQAIFYLAASAEGQSAHLDRILAPVTRGGSSAAYGNDELALELDDVFHAANDMIEHKELSEVECAAIRPLYDLLTRLSGQHNADFWRREALASDPRWDEVRKYAEAALRLLPDEVRAIGRSAGW